MQFVDITNDIAFRKIFGNASKKKSLISFLNAVIVLPDGKEIVDVEIVNPYQLGRLSESKTTIVDVKARDNQGNTFIVEMQIAREDFFHKRILHYTAQSYTSQLTAGQNYSHLKPVYFIGILNFTIAQSPGYFSKHKVLNVETHEHVVRDVEFNFIELPKFSKQEAQLETPIDQWTFFIKNAKDLTLIPENIPDEGLKEAYLEADRQTWTNEELEDYDKANMWKWEQLNQVETARREGDKERQIKTAKAMKIKGFSVKEIIQFTELSEDEIEKL